MSASKYPDSRLSADSSQGFILLEVLMAMSMILGVWITSVEAYQRLVLSLVQQDATRLQLRKESDVFEIQEHGRAQINQTGRVLNHDSTRVPSRNRSMRTTSQSASKDKR